MGEILEFAQILEEKLGVSRGKMLISEPFLEGNQAPSPLKLTPSLAEQLVGLGLNTSPSPLKKPISRGKTAYSSSRKPRPTSPQGAFLLSKRPAHKFSPPQTQAWLCLQQWDAGLTNNFTEAELRRAFRRAALATHPDRQRANASPTNFQAVTSAYETLRGLFESTSG